MPTAPNISSIPLESEHEASKLGQTHAPPPPLRRFFRPFRPQQDWKYILFVPVTRRDALAVAQCGFPSVKLLDVFHEGSVLGAHTGLLTQMGQRLAPHPPCVLDILVGL